MITVTLYKILYERHKPGDEWEPFCMDGCGLGFTKEEACTIREHLESMPTLYRNVQVIAITPSHS